VSLFAVVRWIHPPAAIDINFRQMRVMSLAMAPLLDMLGSVEGDYHSVNRGRAGDSPGDWAKTHLGRSITAMTLDELRSHQGGQERSCWHRGTPGAANLFAVGRYQIIPCTLSQAQRQVDGLSLDLYYNQETQDALAVYLVIVKRRRLGAWLLGQSDDYTGGAQELAKEFASVPTQVRHGRCRRGQSYYCGDSAGNAALLTLEQVEQALRSTRSTLATDPDAQQVIVEAEGARGHLRRQATTTLRRLRAQRSSDPTR